MMNNRLTRLPVGAILFVGAIALIVWCAIASSQRKPTTGSDDPRVVAPWAIPVLKAMCQYKIANGLWPLDLDELDIPIPADGPKKWIYHWHRDGEWSLCYRQPFADILFLLTFNPESGEVRWSPGDGPSYSLDDIGPEFNDVRKLLAEANRSKSEDRAIDVLMQRVNADPDDAVHRQGLVTKCISCGYYRTAFALCDEAIYTPSLKSQAWWFVLAKARAFAEQGQLDLAEAEATAFADQAKSFSYSAIAAYFCMEIGKRSLAMRILTKASAFPIEDVPLPRIGTIGTVVPGMPGDWFTWYASVTAYDLGNWLLARAICDKWEGYLNQKTKSPEVYDQSYHVVRAACMLKTGEFESASAEIKLGMQQRYGMPLSWRADNIEKLKQAIDRKDRAYNHSFGELGKIELQVEYR